MYLNYQNKSPIVRWGFYFGLGQDPNRTAPAIVEVDEGTYLRTEANEAMQEFWEVVDSAGGTGQVFDLNGRRRIAEAIINHYNPEDTSP